MKKIPNTYPNFYSCLEEIGSTTERAIEELHGFVKDPLHIYFRPELKNLSKLVDLFDCKIQNKANEKSNIIIKNQTHLRDALSVLNEDYFNKIEVFSAEIKYPSMYKEISPKGNGEVTLKLKGLLGNFFTIKPELRLSSGQVTVRRSSRLELGPSCVLNPEGKKFEKLYYEGENIDNLFNNFPIILEKFQSLDHNKISSLNYSNKEKIKGQEIYKTL